MARPEAPGRAPLRVEATMFLGIAAFVVVAAVVYAVASQEYAGSTLLLLAGAASLVMGGYLVWEVRSGPRGHGPDDDHGGQYLPGTSIWPFGLGMGAVLMVNGFALGAWAILPGAAIVTLSTIGFARQSRRRA